MSLFSPSYYFDLEQFEHAKLFSNTDKVWEVLKLLEQYLLTLPLGTIEIEVPKGVYLEKKDQIFIAKGTVLEPGCYIKGPCWIGENSVVRHGAYIRGLCLTGKRCVIGHDTEIKNTILLDHAQAPHFAYLGDSILGNRVNLGAGTKCANLKLSGKEISVLFEDQRVSTGMRKLGAIIGDDSQLGCNAVTNPGTLVGKSCFCYPCLNFGGFVPSGSILKSSSKTVLVFKDK